jgi:hypothetical protein
LAEGIVEVTAGSGTKLHSWSKTVGANTVHDEFTLPGEYPYAGYFATPAAGVSCAVAGDDIAQIMAGSSLNVRIRRVRVEQAAAITTAAGTPFQLARVTTAGTGGTAITPSKADNADGASGATAASGIPNATHGTIGQIYLNRQLYPVQTAATAGAVEPAWEWIQQPGMKPIIIPAGTSNGIVIRNIGARAGLTVFWEIEFVETNFV